MIDVVILVLIGVVVFLAVYLMNSKYRLYGHSVEKKDEPVVPVAEPTQAVVVPAPVVQEVKVEEKVEVKVEVKKPAPKKPVNSPAVVKQGRPSKGSAPKNPAPKKPAIKPAAPKKGKK